MTTQSGRPVDRLVGILRQLGCEIGEGWEFNRTYAGQTQRQQGAWSWFLTYPLPGGRTAEVGGYLPVGDLIRESNLVLIEDDGFATLDRSD